MDKNKKTEPKVDLVEQARQLRLQAEELERKVKLARGTRDLKRPNHVGDETSTAELVDAITRLLRVKPMTFQELLEATGARDNRIKGVLMRMQRVGMRLVNLGTEQKALWFLPNDEVFTRIMRAKRATQRR